MCGGKVFEAAVISCAGDGSASPSCRRYRAVIVVKDIHKYAGANEVKAGASALTYMASH